jgi:IPT/TIG domain
MTKTDVICDSCNANIDAIFNPGTGTRTLELIAGQRLVTDCCFVADEIHFTGNGQLVFGPRGEPRKEPYCQEYFVVCRKLVVKGGSKPGGFNPCGPDNPGSDYNNNNAITWLDRLTAANAGSDFGSPAAAGASHDKNVWSDVGQGSPHGADGGDGANGAKGHTGSGGKNAPNFTILALEVDIGVGDNLTIDFDGQNGGKGGKGQTGGDGGDGMGGRDGVSDTTWPGTGCDRQPGNGGNGGDGGFGGDGGDGGAGGRAGSITVVSTAPNISGSGVFLGGKIYYVNDGGDGGEGGKGSRGGKKGSWGKKGKKTSECDEAENGTEGEGFLSVEADKGSAGPHGGGGSLAFEAVKTGTCADAIPLPTLSVTSVTPSSGARGASVNVTIAGVGFDPAATVNVGGLAVSVSNLVIVNATTITCTFDIGALAPQTARDVTVKNSLINQGTLTGGFTVS